MEINDNENNGFPSFIINPNSKTKLWWDGFTNIFFIINYFVTPFNLAVSQPTIEQTSL